MAHRRPFDHSFVLESPRESARKSSRATMDNVRDHVKPQLSGAAPQTFIGRVPHLGPPTPSRMHPCEHGSKQTFLGMLRLPLQNAHFRGQGAPANGAANGSRERNPANGAATKAGLARAGQARPGQARPGQARPGQARPGQANRPACQAARPGQAKQPGHTLACQAKRGHARPNQARLGPGPEPGPVPGPGSGPGTVPGTGHSARLIGSRARPVNTPGQISTIPGQPDQARPGQARPAKAG